MEDTRIEKLDRGECLRLLGSVPLGRVAFTSQALPSVQPVTFALHDGKVVFRTVTGSTLHAALRNTIVAFQADEYDVCNRTGWSVTAVGTARVVTDRARVDELARLPLQPWASGHREHFVTVTIEILHGRRIP